MLGRSPRFVAALAAFALATGVLVAPAYAKAPPLSLQQTFPEPGLGGLGSSVSCLDEWAVAGGQGGAIVYHKVHNTWSRYTSLMPVPAEANPVADGYGLAVDMDDGVVVVGAPDYNGGRGAVYVFTYSSSSGGWFFSQKLQAAAPVAGERFGVSVSVDGATIAVGASAEVREPESQPVESAVYLFTKGTAWTQTQRIPGPSWPAMDWFGHEVCVYGTTLVADAPQYDNHSGAAFVYQVTNGVAGTPQVLREFDSNLEEAPHSFHHFGCGITVRGSTMAVGAPGASSPYGGAYIFVYDTDAGRWVPEAEITKPNAEWYGYTVALCTDCALVGAFGDDGTGTASYYTRSGNTWTYHGDIAVGSGAASGDMYGYAVDLYCSAAMVGAPGDNGGAGTVYFHTTCKPTPVYRFFNPKAGTHFYTDSVEERDRVWSTLSRYFAYEGVGYMTNPENNDYQLHRFYNLRSGSHFYTADLSEVARVKATLSNIYQYDGPTYFVSMTDGGEGKIPVHRFYNIRNGSHFYSADPQEIARVQATLGATYKHEGVAFYLGQ